MNPPAPKTPDYSFWSPGMIGAGVVLFLLALGLDRIEQWIQKRLPLSAGSDREGSP